MDVKELVIVGEEEIGKTTLANALLGWDVFPQSTWDLYIPTEEPARQMLTDSIQLTDTPGYDLLWYQVPEAVTEAVSRADTVIMMFSGFGAEEDFGIENTEPEVAEEIRRWAEKQSFLLKFSVIPSQCSHWRGNPQNRRRLPYQSADWFAMTAVSEISTSQP